MQYYKYIDIDNLEIIQEKTLNYLKERNLIDKFLFWWIKDFDDYINYCPEFYTAFDRYGIKPKQCGTVITNENWRMSPHTDNVPETCRVNIPIINTEGSKTVFYTGGEFVNKNTLSTLRYGEITPETLSQLVKVDEVEVIRPMIFRVNEVHEVKNNYERLPRIVLTVRFDIDPVFLMDN